MNKKVILNSRIKYLHGTKFLILLIFSIISNCKGKDREPELKFENTLISKMNIYKKNILNQIDFIINNKDNLDEKIVNNLKSQLNKKYKSISSYYNNLNKLITQKKKILLANKKKDQNKLNNINAKIEEIERAFLLLKS